MHVPCYRYYGPEQTGALARDDIEVVPLVRWTGEGPPPRQSAYINVEDPDAGAEEERLREVAGQYGLAPDSLSAGPQ